MVDGYLIWNKPPVSIKLTLISEKHIHYLQASGKASSTKFTYFLREASDCISIHAHCIQSIGIVCCHYLDNLRDYDLKSAYIEELTAWWRVCQKQI